MPRYFFTIFDGSGYVDTDGTELTDLNAAQVYAIKYAGQVLLNEAERIRLHSDWCLKVTDEAGCVILRLDFSVTSSTTLANIAAKSIDQALHRPDNL